MFKYSLDKSSKKFICPNCQKKTFVRYFYNENQIYMEHQFGRCDRESNCAYHLKPSQNNNLNNYNHTPILITKSQSLINIEVVSNHGNNFKDNNFIQFLKKYFSVEEIKAVILRYLIGTTSYWKGSTVFWQIDEQNRVCSGKVMLFDKENGKRVKTPFNHINWMHKILKIENFVLHQCLFGLHIVNEFEGETVAIVESEKTAVIMSLFMPNYLWLATGSKTNFKLEMLNPIKRFKIIAFPDMSEFKSWDKTSKELKKLGFRIKCSQILESKNYPEGFDLADVYLEINNVKELTENDKIINHFSSLNSAILDLIETFDLSY